MRQTLCAIVIAAASAGHALAADLPARPEAPHDIYSPQYVWSGFYVGGYVGGQWARITDDTGAAAANAKGYLFGGIVGGNFQMGRFVFGVEADYGAGRMSGSGNTGAGGIIERGEVRGVWNARGRLGVAFDRVLVYGAGGFSFAEGEIQRLGIVEKQWNNGWTAGGGVDYGFATNCVLRVEYLYSSYAASPYTFVPIDTHQIKFNSLHVVRGGAFFKF
jgi:outer membrane immunogenic protein